MIAATQLNRSWAPLCSLNAALYLAAAGFMGSIALSSAGTDCTRPVWPSLLAGAVAAINLQCAHVLQNGNGRS
jgi:hypothetical protein